ncbi:restriction endonuclease [Sphingomonas sp. VNH70]|uniref:restriction endonuclease n=1 Tax=Sphingomonas silueang TaxID=3156617 RepID=UPI0032B4FA70
MSRYDPDFDPTDSDFEQLAREIVELDPDLVKIRGASNQGGDDGVYRNVVTGNILTVEAKFYRQQRNLPRRDVDNLNEAAARNEEAYGGRSDKVLITTSGVIGHGTKKKLKEIERQGSPVIVHDYEKIKEIAEDASVPAGLADGLKACLRKKARRTSV